jgi:hypothetical protein
MRVVTISSGGVNPGEVQTGLGTRVMFVNNDTIAHDIMGGPDPTRPDCHEIDSVGFLSPGQSRQTAPFERSRLCEYVTGYHVPSNLKEPYGSPVSLHLFLRYRAPRPPNGAPVHVH